jgi:hypothetical protein
MKNNEIVSENKTEIRNFIKRGPDVKEIFLTSKCVRINSGRIYPEDIFQNLYELSSINLSEILRLASLTLIPLTLVRLSIARIRALLSSTEAKA